MHIHLSQFGAQCNASVSYYRIWDKAGVACNFCNDFPVATEKTFYNQLQDAGYHTMVRLAPTRCLGVAARKTHRGVLARVQELVFVTAFDKRRNASTPGSGV